MKIRAMLALVIMLGIGLSLGFSDPKSSDMVGTWSGLATLEGMEDANELVLVLAMEEGALVGHMTDEYGTMNESAIKEIKLEKGVFSFSVMGYGPNGEELSLVFKMEMDGNAMTGTLDVPDMGMTGNWEATLQK
jgi:hypothetical protein